MQEVGSPKLRVLLAALLLGDGRVVSVGALKDTLWGGAPPPSAHPSLHNHVARLRRMLDAPDRLVTEPTGYLLRVAEGELDVHVFDALTDTARAAHAAGHWDEVLRACTDALALWRGAPLAGLPPEVGGHALARRLGEARSLLLEWRYDAELGLGDDPNRRARLADLVTELTALAAEYPLRETYHRQLMLALQRTGRRAEALAVHRDLRARLVEELGIEPGPGVRQAHVEVLRGTDAGRSGGRPGGATAPPGADASPRHLGASGEGHPPAGSGRGDRLGSGDRARPGAEGAGTGGGGRPTSAAAMSKTAPRRRSSLAPLVASFLASSPTPARPSSAAWPAEATAVASGAEATAVASGAGGAADGAGACGLVAGAGACNSSAGSGACGSSVESDGAGCSAPGAGCSAASGVAGSSGAVASSAAGLAGSVGSAGSAVPVSLSASASPSAPAGLGATAHPGAVAEVGPGSRNVGWGGAPVRSSSSPSPPVASAPSLPPLPPPSGVPRSDASPAGGVRHPAGDFGAMPVVTRPGRLPPAPVPFVGRGELRDELCRVLVPPARTTVGPPASWNASRVAVVSGTAGVGKSALAVRVAQDLKKRFLGGRLYIDLHGNTPGVPPLAPAQALSALLRAFGCAPCDVPEDPESAAELLRSLLAPTRTLLILDDAAHAAQVRPLLPVGPGCAVIVTSRSPLTGLDGVARFPLGPLSDEDGAALLREVSGRDEFDAGHPLVALTGRLPLALRILAGRLRAREALTPDTLVRQLAVGPSRLPHLECDDLSVRRSLAVAHDALAASARETDRDAALVLYRIGALDLPDYGVPLVARLLGTDELRAEAALARLVDVALLEETAYGRYVPYDLVRDFTRELARGTTGCVPERPCARDLDRARHLDLVRAWDLDRARDLDFDRAQDADRACGQDQGHDHDQRHDRDRRSDHDQHHDHDHDNCGRVPEAPGERAGRRARPHPRSPRWRGAPSRAVTDRASGTSVPEGGGADRFRSR
ncbi:BTAD domain-containing putative transcriptional regulator [Streptomyces sp. bgisy022]|uniref:AfsR/SARP family transcriptional regulator n=1 Tax=Streptomyces sp. bgisy022 TaxID=3413769 RepID=UPI003D74EE63